MPFTQGRSSDTYFLMGFAFNLATCFLEAAVPDLEAQTLASDIGSAPAKSHWYVNPVNPVTWNIPISAIEPGVQVRTLERINGISGTIPDSQFSPASRAAKALVDLLSLDLGPPLGPISGVAWKPDIVADGFPMGLTRYGFQFQDGSILITVGIKPTEEYFLTHQPTVPK
jgi:hypothetical protein